MKLDKLVGDRFKERPAECSIDSHALMVRGGYMKFMASGIYSQYMPLKRMRHLFPVHALKTDSAQD